MGEEQLHEVREVEGSRSGGGQSTAEGIGSKVVGGRAGKKFSSLTTYEFMAYV